MPYPDVGLCLCIPLVQSCENLYPRLHRPLGIVFMRSGIAEIDEHSIPEILRDVTLKAFNHYGAGLLIGADDLSQFFRIKLDRKRRGAHQIAEQHRELTPLSFGGGTARDRT